MSKHHCVSLLLDVDTHAKLPSQAQQHVEKRPWGTPSTGITHEQEPDASPQGKPSVRRNSESLTYVQGGIFPPHVVIDVGNSQGLDRGSTNAQEDLCPDEQQVHHVGSSPIPADKVRVWSLIAGGPVDSTHIPPFSTPAYFSRFILVLVGQKFRQGRKEGTQGHDYASTSYQAWPVSSGSEVAHEEDEGQVANLEAAGNDAHVSTLEVESPLQGG